MWFEVYNANPLGLGMGVTVTQPWRWRLRSRNGQITASGEGYASKYNAERAVDSIKAQIQAAEVRHTAS